MIRSSRERNRSCSPVSRRSRGRIAPPPSNISRARNHSLRFEGIAKQFARKPQRRHPIPAKAITWKGSITHLVQRLGNTSRATNAAPASFFIVAGGLGGGLWRTEYAQLGDVARCVMTRNLLDLC